MQFTFISLFQNLIEGYLSDSILHRAIQNKLISVDYLNPRDYSKNKHYKVDDTAVGGGAGMVMTPQPLFNTLKSLKQKDKNVHIIFTTPVGKPFRQNDAMRLARQKKHIAFVSGRYEGIDERVIEEFADEVFSIGDFILTGGELPSLVMMDAISRNVENVLGNTESLSGESFEKLLLEAPNFAKPHKYENFSSPSEYLKGNHSKITDLKNEMAMCKTQFFRPDLYERFLIRRKNDEK